MIKMKYLLIVFLAFMAQAASARGPRVFIIDGEVVFEPVHVSTGGEQNVTAPTLEQVNIATCTLQSVEFVGTAFETAFDDGGFGSASDYQECFATRRGLLRRIIHLRRAIASLEDFPTLQLLLRRRLAWLVHYFNNVLP